MYKTGLLLVALSMPGLALACGGSKKMASSDTTPKPEVTLAANVDATACAKKASLVGSNCSYSTGMMAQRVMAEGSDFAFTGSMKSAANSLKSHVAAPFTVGADIRVIANEVLEGVNDNDARYSLSGKLLEVDGVKYFLLTSVAAAQS